MSVCEFSYLFLTVCFQSHGFLGSAITALVCAVAAVLYLGLCVPESLAVAGTAPRLSHKVGILTAGVAISYSEK